MVSADRGKQQMINKRSGSKGTLLPELRKVWMYPVAGGGGGVTLLQIQTWGGGMLGS